MKNCGTKTEEKRNALTDAYWAASNLATNQYVEERLRLGDSIEDVCLEIVSNLTASLGVTFLNLNAGRKVMGKRAFSALVEAGWRRSVVLTEIEDARFEP